MKKYIIGFLLLAGVSSLVYLKFFKRPDFNNMPEGGLHAALWDFEHAADEREKFKAAAMADMYNRIGKPPETLDDGDKKLLAEIKSYNDSWQAKVKAFEQSLKPEDVDSITADHPDSMLARLKVLSSIDPKNCEETDYTKLKETYSVSELGSRSTLVMAVVSKYEGRFGPDYYERLIPILKREDVDPVVEIFYEIKFSLGADQDPKPDEEALIKKGVPRDELKAYVYTMTEAAPSCLGQINANYIRFLTSDVIRTKADQLMKLLNEYVAKNNDFPAELSEVDENYMQLDDTFLDHDLFIVKEDKVLTLYHDGEDYKPKTEDDIALGSVNL